MTSATAPAELDGAPAPSGEAVAGRSAAAATSILVLPGVLWLAAFFLVPLGIMAVVSLGAVDKQFCLEATLIGHLPGLDQQDAQELMDRTHDVCPISKAIGANIPVGLEATV